MTKYIKIDIGKATVKDIEKYKCNDKADMFTNEKS